MNINKISMRNGNSVPDNEELMLGDDEWLKEAYPEA